MSSGSKRRTTVRKSAADASRLPETDGQGAHISTAMSFLVSNEVQDPAARESNASCQLDESHYYHQ